MTIKNLKNNYCLIGSNIQKSYSPKIYEYWFNKYNISGSYKIENIKIEEFDNKIGKIFEFYDGFNITKPFKEKIVKKLESLYDSSKDIKVVNCVVTNTKYGYNTDTYGFKRALAYYKINLSEYDMILLLGAGGAAKEVAKALKNFNGTKFCYNHRPITKKEVFTKLNFKILANFHELTPRLLVINCSSQIEYLKDQIKYKSYLDINYNVKMNLEKKEGFASIMLIYQAQKAFEIWFGFKPKIDKGLKNLVGGND